MRTSVRFGKKNASVCEHVVKTEKGSVDVFELVSYETLVLRLEFNPNGTVDVWFSPLSYYSTTTAKQVSQFLQKMEKETDGRITSGMLRAVRKDGVDAYPFTCDEVTYHYINTDIKRWGLHQARTMLGVRCYG